MPHETLQFSREEKSRMRLTARTIASFAVQSALMLLPVSAVAQSVASGIAGVVTDTSGAVLPGVTVEAASPVLIEKIRTVVTDAKGEYKIVELRPGTYVVTFSLSGFNTLRREALELSAGLTATVNAELKVGSVTETVTVSGASPVVDIQNVRSQNVISRETLDTLPTPKNFSAYITLTPGATNSGTGTGTRDVGGDIGEGYSNVALHDNHADGHLTIDGVDASSVGFSGSIQRYKVNQMGTQDVQIETQPYSAEVMTGGVAINIVPKDGGNIFSGGANGDYAGPSLQSSNVTSALRARGLTQTNALIRLFDSGFGVGGPFRKDSVWFYTSNRWWGTKETLAGLYYNASPNPLFYTPDLSKPAFSHSYNRDNSVRVTWQATPKQKFIVAEMLQRECGCAFHQGVPTVVSGVNSFGNTTRAPEAGVDFWFPEDFTQATWTYTATSRLLFEAGFALRLDGQDTQPTVSGAANNQPVLELSTGMAYGSMLMPGGSWLYDYGNSGYSTSYNEHFAVSYVTGSHSFKVGFQDISGRLPVVDQPNFDTLYVFNHQVPVDIYEAAYPFSSVSKMRYNIGTYGQDQWTLKRLTLNLGVRFDFFNAYNPAQTRPAGRFLSAISFAEQDNVPNWKDWSPRLGAAYDVFGDGRTAVKMFLGRFMVGQGLTFAQNVNPVASVAAVSERTWNDTNGNYVPDCDLLNPAVNGECGAINNKAFGTPVINSTYSPGVLNGWGVRPYNWQGSVSLQQQVRPGMAVNVGYFRTWYGNILVTQNTATTPGNYDPYCITAPADPRLPGGGGNQVCGLYDVAPAKFGQVTSLVTQGSNFGNFSEVYNGFDVTLNARFGHGGLLSGGLNTGQTVVDNCPVVNAPVQFCKTTLGWAGQAQVKFAAAYPLPWGLQASGVFQNLPGIPYSASYVATNALIAPSLGRNLAACGTASNCTATTTVQLVAPFTLFEPRQTQLDARLSKSFQVGHVRLQPRIDAYNLFNANSVVAESTRYGTTWTTPSSIMAGRFFKLGALINF
jgi:hypothetical protein